MTINVQFNSYTQVSPMDNYAVGWDDRTSDRLIGDEANTLAGVFIVLLLSVDFFFIIIFLLYHVSINYFIFSLFSRLIICDIYF